MNPNDYSPTIDMNSKGLQTIFELADGDTSIIIDTIDDTLKYTPSLMVRIAEGMASNDLKKVLLAAHSLKSSTAIVGAMKLSNICQDLETLTKNGEPLTNTEEFITMLYREYDQLRIALEKWRAELNA